MVSEDDFRSVQSAYIEEMRALQPELFRWWMDLSKINEINEPPPADVSERWPLDISGHPRVIEVFRRYYMQVEDQNDQLVDSANDRRAAQIKPANWMEELEPPTVDTFDPIELLVWEVEDIAPDIFRMVAGIVYVPVGLNQHDERV